MSIVRVGTTTKYADGWDAIFSGKGKRSGAKKTAGAARKSSKKSPARKKK